MSVGLIIDKNVTLTLKGGAGTPTVAIAGSARLSGSISITENLPNRTLVRTADGRVVGDVETSDPDSFASVTVTLLVAGSSFAGTSAAEVFDVVRALMFQDATKISGTAWTSAYAYTQGGGCDFAVDMDLAVTYCSSGSSTTKTLSLGAVTVRSAPSLSIGEAQSEYSVTFECLEEINWNAWA